MRNLIEKFKGRVALARARKAHCPKCNERIRDVPKIANRADFVLLECKCGEDSLWDLSETAPKVVCFDDLGGQQNG